jgi:hypothetical protein
MMMTVGNNRLPDKNCRDKRKKGSTARGAALEACEEKGPI